MASVYAQTSQPDEVIVVDDGSTDNTQLIQKDFPKIRYIYQKNMGVSSARNTGIQHATYSWIAFLDSDDEWCVEKLALQKEFHTKRSHCLASYTDEIWIRENKEIKIPKKFHKIGEDPFLENIEYCNIAPSSVMMHKSVFDAVGLFDTTFEVCEDYDLWLRVALRKSLCLLDEKLLIKYGGHNDQLSMKYWGMDRWRVKALRKHLHTKYHTQVQETLIKKYTLLKKGAVKYDKIALSKQYEMDIQTIKGFN